MTARNPLFDFMPYGAPELLAAQRPNLLRALALASGLALLAFALLQSLGLSVPIKPIEFPIAQIHRYPLEPVPLIPQKLKGPPSVRPSPPIDHATPVLVEDTVDPVLPQPDFGFGADDGSNDAIRDQPLPTGAAVGLEEKEPIRGEWVNVDEMPVAVKIVKPTYPDLPKELGVEGPVWIYVLVGKDGRVVRVEVDEKRSTPMLIEAAVTAARSWVFQPALTNGHPVMVWVGEKFVFKLH